MGTTSALLRSPEFVLEDGSLLSATPFDPLLIFLSLLHQHASEVFVPFSQLISQCDYSDEVRRNLTWVSSLPAVAKRISLVADIRRACSSTREANAAQLGGDLSCSSDAERALQFCRLNLQKAVAYLQVKHAKLRDTILALRLPFRECAVCVEKVHYSPRTTGGNESNQTQIRNRTSTRLGTGGERVTSRGVTGHCEIDTSAADRLAEEILSGYLPKCLFTAFKERRQSEGCLQTTKSTELQKETSCGFTTLAVGGDKMLSTLALCSPDPLSSSCEARRGKRSAPPAAAAEQAGCPRESSQPSEELHDTVVQRRKRIKHDADNDRRKASPARVREMPSEPHGCPNSENTSSGYAPERSPPPQVIEKEAGVAHVGAEEPSTSALHANMDDMQSANPEPRKCDTAGLGAANGERKARAKKHPKAVARAPHQALISSFFRKKA
ncbi:Ydr279p family (RNase H2 complex component) protein [Besnoitia besnoiti]|uniref:Ydr279p family (RNase H2 complex component) protein n=1 Tax=Besnoitia besnoiti TaxID=94643 RepID=A0A2A9M042_BESBE|nr:Ydr279p family (RNase H2 complex component) protein [Besnoitia besnoiti]PFH31968.1 Ydr279p family (RNase H2 complex component) protein [Besnoitia besnoiti]